MASRVCWIWGLLHRTILKEWKAMDAFGKYWLWFLLQRVVAWSGHSSESQKSIFQRQTQPLLMVYFLLLTYLAFQCVLVILPDVVQPWHLLTVNRLTVHCEQMSRLNNIWENDQDALKCSRCSLCRRDSLCHSIDCIQVYFKNGSMSIYGSHFSINVSIYPCLNQ